MADSAQGELFVSNAQSAQTRTSAPVCGHTPCSKQLRPGEYRLWRGTPDDFRVYCSLKCYEEEINRLRWW